MGTTIRREPNLTALPKKVTPHYENVLNFKGLHITDNPFTADQASASDMLNVYVDDNNALTVRPRLEKDNDYDTIVGGYTLVKVEPLKNGKILLLLNGTTPVVKLVINNTTYTVSGVGTINVNTCNFYEDGDISVDGKIYLFDENGAKYIKKDGSAYVCGSISDIAYTPTVEVHKDLALGKTTENEPYNAFNNKYKLSYITNENLFSSPLPDGIDSKKITVTTINNKYENISLNATTGIGYKLLYFITDKLLTLNKSVTSIATNGSGNVVIYCCQDESCYISRDYGRTFDVLEISYENNGIIEWRPLFAKKIQINSAGNIFWARTSDNKLIRVVNNVFDVSVDLSNTITISNTQYKTYRQNMAIMKVSYTGDSCYISQTFVYNGGGTPSIGSDGECLLEISRVVENQTVVTKFGIINPNATSIGGISDVKLAKDDGDVFVSLCYQAVTTIGDAATVTNFIINRKNKTISSSYTYQRASGESYENLIWVKSNVLSIITSSGVINRKITSDINDTIVVSDTAISYLFTFVPDICLLINNLVYATRHAETVICEIKTNANGVVIDNTLNKVVYDTLITPMLATDTFTVSDIGVYYGVQNKAIYTNNAYLLDIDWLAVEYTDHTSDYKINKSTNYAIWRDSLWLYGYKNQLGWSGYVNGKRDFTYFPEDQIFELGIDTTPLNEKSDITGFNIIGDSVASAYKRNKIFLITPTTINNIDTYIYSECKAEQGNDTMGQTVTTPLSALPIQVNRDGVFALTNLTNVYAADKVATLISAKINEKFLKEDLSNIKLISFKYWLFIFIPGDTSKVYVYDDRFAEWYYWELPVKILNIFKTHDSLYCVSDDNVIFKFNPKEKIVSIDSSDAVTLYYDDVYVEGADNCFDAYGIQGKNIVWYWSSQILPLNSVSYAKQLNKTTFIVADSDVTDGYAFNFSIKGWRKKRTLVKSSDLDGTVYSVQATTKRTNINRAHFIQLTVTNAMLENHQLVLSKTLKTDIDTNDQKVRLIGVSFKFKYLEV